MEISVLGIVTADQKCLHGEPNPSLWNSGQVSYRRTTKTPLHLIQRGVTVFVPLPLQWRLQHHI